MTQKVFNSEFRQRQRSHELLVTSFVVEKGVKRQ